MAKDYYDSKATYGSLFQMLPIYMIVLPIYIIMMPAMMTGQLQATTSQAPTQHTTYECVPHVRRIQIITVINCNFSCHSDCSCSLGNQTLTTTCPGSLTTVGKIAYPLNIKDTVYLDLQYKGKGIHHIARNAFVSFSPMTSKTKLNLAGNKIKYLEPSLFEGLHNLNWLSLSENQIQTIECTAFFNVETLLTLYLQNNVLSSLEACFFEGLGSLETLSLSGNFFEDIGIGVFTNLQHLQKLDLSSNILTVLDNGTFFGLRALKKLSLESNYLEDIEIGVLQNLLNLEQLYLQNNRFKVLRNGMFWRANKLQSLSVHSNLIAKIDTGVFSDLKDLRFLYLTNNSLTEVVSGVFQGLAKLEVLLLDSNKLRWLPPDVFREISGLFVLDLNNNDLYKIATGIFDQFNMISVLNLANNTIDSLQSKMFSGHNTLDTLDLRGNPLKWVNPKMFIGLSNKTKVLVSSYAICCYIESATCIASDPRTPFLTCQRLLPLVTVRVTMLILGTLAVLANGYVLFWRCMKLRFLEKKVQSLLIINLSFSDLLMGVYMLTITSADMYFYDSFPSNADKWREGYVCTIAGAIALISSEASVFFVTLISIDRLLGITCPVSHRGLTTRRTRIAATMIWVIAISLSIVSVVVGRNNPNFYNLSEVCIGLPLTRTDIIGNSNMTVSLSDKYTNTISVNVSSTTNTESGMYFSIAVFIALNGICFLTVACCYLTIFIKVQKSRQQSGRAQDFDQQVKMAARMSVIVLTDFVCWVPVIVACILVQGGVLTVSPTVYAWTVAFILPVNSSINPFLYTLSMLLGSRKRARKGKGTSSTSLTVVTRRTRSESSL